MKKDFKQKLEELGLYSSNCVVICSGILEVLGIRESDDIDVVVKQEEYDTLKKSKHFNITENCGREILKNDLFEIGTEWLVLGKSYVFEDFIEESEIIDEVRYNNLNFLLKVKKSWVTENTFRPKDIRDIELINEYLKQKKGI